MDTHRLASPLEVESELPLPSRQPPVKTRGASLEGAIGALSSQADLRPFLKDSNGITAGGWSFFLLISRFVYLKSAFSL